jgi:hypothetical protein
MGADKAVGETMGADKVVAAAVQTCSVQPECSVRTVGLIGGPTRFWFFPIYPKPAQHWKFKMSTLSCFKNSQFLHAAHLGYYVQFFQLFQHPIPNINRAKNPGSDSTFESLMNFKRGLNLMEKIGKFPKILSWLIFTKVNLVGITYMQECELPYKCQMMGFE